MTEQNIDMMLKFLNDAAPIAACGLLDLARGIAAAQAAGREVRMTVVFRANGQIALEHPLVSEPVVDQAEAQPTAEPAAEPQPETEHAPAPDQQSATTDGTMQEPAAKAEKAPESVVEAADAQQSEAAPVVTAPA